MSTVLHEVRGTVHVITLNRPEKRNAASLELQERLLEVYEALGSDDTVRAVVLTGAGSAFCAGGDFSTMRLLADRDPDAKDLASRVNRDLTLRMLRLPVPTIAAVNGPAVGFGAGLVALCDLVVIDRGAFLSDPHVAYGLGASPVLQLVWPHLTSRGIAKELLMTGRRVPAEEAARLGLANRVVDPGTALHAAMELANELVALPPIGVSTVKRALTATLVEEWERELTTGWACPTESSWSDVRVPPGS